MLRVQTVTANTRSQSSTTTKPNLKQSNDIKTTEDVKKRATKRFRVKCFECKTATASRAANANTKRGIENSFPGIQMFVQASNKLQKQLNLNLNKVTL